MLNLIYGRSGSGKTYRMLERMAELTGQGKENLFWIVPEQHSFACERALLNRLGPVQASRVQVLSFSRLADRVFRQVGGLAGQPLDEGVRALLMSRALEQVVAVDADKGTPMSGLRPRLVTDSAYVEQLLSLWEELCRCAVTTQQLEQVAAQMAQEEDTPSLLTNKTEDLCRVFFAYEGLVKSSGLRETDDLTRLADVLPESTLLRQAAVFVDGFKGFTQQELAVLDAVLPQAEELTVALCTDTLGAEWPGETTGCSRAFSLFAPVTATAQRLHRLAQDRGMAWNVICLEENRRAQTPALKALETGLYAPAPAVYEGAAPEVIVTPCATVYEECRYAVRQLRRLLREGYRCREIAVAVRQLGDYQGLLDDLMACEGIPYYMDARRDLLCEPLVVYVRSALRVAVGGWRTEELLRLMKTDLWPLTPVEIAEIENYVYTWRIEGSRWEQEWTENPQGIDRKMTSADDALLQRLNERRQALVDSLTPLRGALRGGATGRQFAMAVYRWLADQRDLPERIAHQTEVLEAMAQPVLAAHAARLWDELMKILDRFVVALGDQHLPASRLEDLFTMLCRTMDMGTIPQGLDAVQVGSVNRMRFDNPRVVLVLGANEGVLPAYPMGDGLLTEEERRRLKARGLTLAEDMLTQCVEERYYAYLALTAPSQQLIVTYRSGAETGPSPVVTAIQKILPGHAAGVAQRPDGADLESADEMFRRLALEYRTPSAFTESLKEVLGDSEEYKHRLRSVQRAAEQGVDYRLNRPETAKALFKQDMALSATQADVFYHCKFKYFCQYGLRLQERRVAEIDGRIFGTLVHYAAEVLLQEYCQKGNLLDQLREQPTTTTPDAALLDRLYADVERVLSDYIRREMGGFANKNGRFMYQVGLAQLSARNLLWHTMVELQQGKFTPLDFELNIYTKSRFKEDGVLSLQLPMTKNQGSVQLQGKVDRVDLYIQDNEDGTQTAYVRVVDYKTGSTTFDLSTLSQGQCIQMLVYLFTICENSAHYADKLGRSDGLHPAGVLYHPLSNLIVTRGAKPEQRLRGMKMNGVVLADPQVVKAMDPSAQGLFIPAKMKPVKEEGEVETVEGDVVTARQFDVLRRTVERLLVEMGETLLDGVIDAVPTDEKDAWVPSCTYCEYKAVCGRESGDRINELKRADFAVAMEQLEKEGEPDGME